MTLNQIISRLKGICLAHKQIRSFYFGDPTDFLTDKTTRYAGNFLHDQGGSLDVSGKVQTISFKLYALDLVHVSENAKENELDVQSDMLSVLADLVAEINHSSYTDWKISATNAITLLREEFDDLVAGAVVDIAISTPYEQDVCAVPTDELPIQVNPDDMKFVYDEKYVALGNEGFSLTLEVLKGKKILMITREFAPLYKVSVNPDPVEYTWDLTTLIFGTQLVTPGERFLILWRNY